MQRGKVVSVGFICTTRVVTGVGVPQITALFPTR
ncbi:IMP dehydrogenase [Salmonella enterica subsp. enterica]|nr:IMP dehydrogenase [Salmonella enterica subsp. enterica]